jgi:nitrite reductase/ring-hydroxylating ferredoxin subunit
MQINSPQADAVDSSIQSEVLEDNQFRVKTVPRGSALLVGDAAVSNAVGSFCANPARCTHKQGPLNEGNSIDQQ